MNTISYTQFRKSLAGVLDKVNEDHKPMIVTRTGGKEPVVVMSLEDYNAYEEMAHLMSSPRNAQRLNESIAQAERGEVERHELIDE